MKKDERRIHDDALLLRLLIGAVHRNKTADVAAGGGAGEGPEEAKEGCGTVLAFFSLFFTFFSFFAFVISQLLGWFIEPLTHVHLGFWHVLGLVLLFIVMRHRRAQPFEADDKLSADVRFLVFEHIFLALTLGAGALAHAMMVH